MPWLYHHYAGHDNNRDWFMLNLPETRAVTKVLYHDWLPQIHLDEHQHGPQRRPALRPAVHGPARSRTSSRSVWRGVNLVGTGMSLRPPEARHERRRQRPQLHGLVHRRLRRHLLAPQRHRHPQRGGLGRGWPRPIYIEPNEIPTCYYEKMHGLRRSLARRLVAAARPRRLRARPVEEPDQDGRPPQGGPPPQLLPDVQELGREGRQGPALRLRHPGRPARLSDHAQDARGPADGRRRDPSGQGRLHRPAAASTTAGSFVVKMAQPYKPFAWALLEKQKYPDMRQYPGGPPVPPYDNAGWTLPLQMGVICDEVEEAFEAKLEKIDADPLPQGPAPRASAGLFRPRRPGQRLLRRGRRPAQGQGRGLADRKTDRPQGPRPPGRKLHRQERRRREESPAGACSKSSTWPSSTSTTSPGSPRPPVKFPRIGLFQSWRGNMDEGWTRYVFDDLGIPYKIAPQRRHQGDEGRRRPTCGPITTSSSSPTRTPTPSRARGPEHPGRRRPSRPWPGWSARPRSRPSTRAASARRAWTPSRPSSRRAAVWSP
ncbi:MAG: hypothetical protein M0C28_38310 [Candidatus Moduliflexus flocculans]|nr:hypothetical protein [Candidatus Moduliflexus flocculans]